MNRYEHLPLSASISPSGGTHGSAGRAGKPIASMSPLCVTIKVPAFAVWKLTLFRWAPEGASPQSRTRALRVRTDPLQPSA